jgi:hypothetical protein
MHLRVPDLGVTSPKTYDLGHISRWAAGKTLTAGTPGRGAHRRSTGELDGIFPANQVSTFSGYNFCFGSWVCIADGEGDFHHFLIDMKPKTPALFSQSNLDKFIDDLNDLSIHGSATRIKEESASSATSSGAATTFLGLDLFQSEDSCSRSRLGQRNLATDL